MLPANIGQAGDNALSIAASSNKGTLIRYLNDQVEDGFYTLVIDSLKDSNFDLSTMTVDDEVRAQCTNDNDPDIMKSGKTESCAPPATSSDAVARTIVPYT